MISAHEHTEEDQRAGTGNTKLHALIRKRPYFHQYGAIPAKMRHCQSQLPSPNIMALQRRHQAMVVPEGVEFLEVEDLHALGAVIPGCEPALSSPKMIVHKGIPADTN